MSNNELIKALQNPELYDHPIIEFKVIETHISWVILTGQYVYKIKKPVDFGVLDFSTLAKRGFYCEEEVRLNKFLAPELYEGVVAITGTVARPQINGAGEVLEYAIKMREFPQAEIFTEIFLRHELTPALIDKLAKVVAEFHLRTPVAPADTEYGTPQHAHFPVIQNFTQVLPWLTDAADKAQIARLQQWAEQQFQQQQALFLQRKQQGFIRDCHGDLHLGNIILHKSRPILFDRIEFNPDLRWNDVMADIAFLVMDLMEKQQPRLAQRLMNYYVAHTGDYAGLALLRYYISYRAMVRAKVALFHSTQSGLEDAAKKSLQHHYRKLVALAETSTQASPPALLITHGLSGSGKSTVARFIVEQLNAIQISSDVERKRLFDLALQTQTNSALNAGIYAPDVTDQTYARLLQLARIVILAGYTAVIDATFLKRAQRAMFAELAAQLRVPFVILHCQAARNVTEDRLQQRAGGEHEPSEADVTVLNMQSQVVESLDDKEKQRVIQLNTQHFNEQEMVQQLQRLYLA